MKYLLLIITLSSNVFFAANAFSSPERLAANRLAFWEKVISGSIQTKKGLRNETPPNELGLTLGLSSMTDAVKSLGANKVVRTGDASASEATLCYKGHDGTVAGLGSNEMHGSKFVADISIFSAGVESNFPNCVLSRKINKSLKTKSGLSLGLSRKVTEDIFGTPSKKEKSYSLYRYEIQSKSKASESSSDSYDCTDGEEIMIFFKGDVVDWFALRIYSFC